MEDHPNHIPHSAMLADLGLLRDRHPVLPTTCHLNIIKDSLLLTLGSWADHLQDILIRPTCLLACPLVLKDLPEVYHPTIQCMDPQDRWQDRHRLRSHLCLTRQERDQDRRHHQQVFLLMLK